MGKKSVIDVFNKDALGGSYKYNDKSIYSVRIVNERLTNETALMIGKHYPGGIVILDVGCGDGSCTIDLFEKIKPKKIIGFDPAVKAVMEAKRKVKTKNKGKVIFKVGDVYNVDKEYKGAQYDVVVVRGVLHHLENPAYAIKKMGKVFKRVVVVEPNGYNPILKIVERTLLYHKKHGEKSYFPYLINKWFRESGFGLVEQKFFNINPVFCNKQVAKFLKTVSPFFEGVPVMRKIYCSINICVYEKII